MFRNYFLINVFLLLIVCLLGFKFYRVLVYEKDIPSGASFENSAPDRIKSFSKGRVPGKGYFNVITEKDIFRSSRSSSLIGITGRVQSSPKDLPVLFGTIIVGGKKRALLKDAPGKTAKMYKVNDSVSGYLIVDIQDDRVLLEGGGQTVEVKLRGKKKLKPLPKSSAKKPSSKRAVKRRVNKDSGEKASAKVKRK